MSDNTCKMYRVQIDGVQPSVDGHGITLKLVHKTEKGLTGETWSTELPDRDETYQLLLEIFSWQSNVDDFDNLRNQIAYYAPDKDELRSWRMFNMPNKDTETVDLNDEIGALYKRVRGA